jgi:hypothetical protein
MKKTQVVSVLLALSVLMTVMPSANAQETTNSSKPAPTNAPHQCPMNMQSRGDAGMGFSQTKTTHHFILAKDGGVISVEANQATDTESRDEIRMHLAHIAQAFAGGDFEIPMFVHDQVPPGVGVMKSKKEQIKYRFEETTQGGRVVISSADLEAISAIQGFLSFQVREHKTGDSLAIP